MFIPKNVVIQLGYFFVTILENLPWYSQQSIADCDWDFLKKIESFFFRKCTCYTETRHVCMD